MQQPKPQQPQSLKLAFSGSGFLAPIHAGAFSAFVDAGYVVDEVAGTSGGSIMAALVASGKTADEIKDIAFRPLPKDILKLQYSNLFHFSSSLAINDGQVLESYMHEVIGDTVFNDTVMPCTIVATDIRAPKPFVFSKATTPLTTLYKAARASSAVPFVYAPVKLPTGELLVDGGEVNNIPVSKLSRAPNSLVVGIQVYSPSPLPKKFTLIDYAQQHIESLLESNEGTQDMIGRLIGASIIKVSSNGYGFLNANLSIEQKKTLFNNGYSAVQIYLKNHKA